MANGLTLCQTAMVETRIQLNNGDSLESTNVFNSNKYYYLTKSKEDSIMQLYLNRILSNPLLKIIDGFDSKQIEDCFTSTINEVWSMYKLPLPAYSDGSQYAYYMNDGFYGGSMPHVIAEVSPVYHPKMNVFLHKAIKIKKIREFGYSILGDMLEAYCKIFPKDYRDNLIKQLKECVAFIGEMEKHQYEAVDLGNNPFELRLLTLYVDGKENPKLASGLKGFIIRRIIVDNIPKNEIAMNMEMIIKRIQDTKTNDFDFYYHLSVNNELHYYEKQSYSGWIIGNSQIPGDDYNIVFYNTEKDGSYYMFNNKWQGCCYVIDKSGEIIYDKWSQ